MQAAKDTARIGAQTVIRALVRLQASPTITDVQRTVLAIPM